MNRIFTLVLLFALLVAGRAAAQQPGQPSANDTAVYPYWTSMMQDPDVKFRDAQRAFETYWAGRTDRKGNGWKVFKRWEYIMQDQVQPDGKLPAPGSVLAEYNQWKSIHAPASSSGNWMQIGPVALPGNATGQPNGLGRINGITFHPTDPNTIYIGSPSGGLWKTTNGGITWTVLTASTPTLGVSSILLHPTNSTQILIGTGDRDGGDAPGMGVYKSTDGGTTWTASNSGMGNVTVGMMLRHPSDANTILAATAGGIYKSTDGGTTWVRKSSNTSSYKDIRFKPGDPTIVYATESGKFYRSTNTGESWTQITAGVLTGTRLVIGVTAAAPSTVYLVQTSGVFTGLLKSTNDGVSFTTQSTSPNLMDYNCDGAGSASQAWYDLCVAVDPANASTIYVGGINIWKSTNGGVNWTINTHWVGSSWGVTCAPSVHADIHVLEFSPVNGKLFTGCDGGIYNTSNGGTAWSDLSSGLGIAQVYKIGQAANNSGITMNGYQDNGTAKNTMEAFTTVIGGDGMECIVDYSDSNVRYGSIYYGDIYRSMGTGGYNPIAGNGTNGINESGGWVTPYTLHETNPSTMFIGYKNVWRSTNVKASSSWSVSWTKISSGETGTCIVIEHSPANVDILYVTRSGSVKRTDNANATTPTWTTCTLPGGNNPSDLEAHPTDPNTVYAVAGTRVYKSTDKGMTWTNISGTLPSTNINCLVYDKYSSEGIYIGNKTAVWFKDASLSDWILYSTGLPTVDVRELEIYYNAANPASNRLKAATYGRGLWESDLYTSFAVAPPNQNVSYTAGSTTFTVNAGPAITWTATSNATWCTPTAGGTGSGTITANYLDNPTILNRVATLTVTPSGGLPVSTVTVTQAGAPPSLAVTPPNQNVAYTAGTTTFNVACNTDWTAVSNATWCTINPSGSGNGTITANYAENPDLTGRVATITVTVTGLPPQDVTVTQDAALPTLAVMPVNQNVAAPSGTTTYSVTSNTTWTAVSKYSWCTVTPSGTGNGTIYADYTENTSVDQRVDTITVTVTGLSPQLVTVTQAGTAATLAVDPANHDVAPEAGSCSFTVTSNTTWTAISDSAWCTVTPSGSGNGTIVADYAENPRHAVRVATITVTVNGTAPQLVTVTQDKSVVSVPENGIAGIRIYPNPATGQFTIDGPGLKNAVVALLDITGNAVITQTCTGETACRFDLSAVPQGCYFVRIQAASGTLTRKLVVIR